MVIGFDYSGKYPASFCEWKASQVAVFVREDIEGVIDNARLSSSGFLKEVEISAAVGPIPTTSPSMMVPGGRYSKEVAIQPNLSLRTFRLRE